MRTSTSDTANMSCLDRNLIKFNQVLHLGKNTMMHQYMMGADQLESSFFTMGVTKHWNGLPKEVVESLPLKTLKKLSQCGSGQPALDDPA